MTFPESELIESEITLRKMRFPTETQMAKPSLLRWFALSNGLISLKETRTRALAIFDAFFKLFLGNDVAPTTKQIREYLEQNSGSGGAGLPSERLIRYHLNKLVTLGIVERKQNRYLLKPPALGRPNDFAMIFDEVIAKQVLETLERNKNGFSRLISSYSK